MKKIYRDFIEYHGINMDPKITLKNFSQLNVDYNFRISEDKPDIQSINKVWIESKTSYHEIVKTPVGVSLNGQIATGYKLLVSGDIDMKIEYFSGGCEDVLNMIQGSFPFCSYITLPNNFDTLSIILPYVYIEDVFCEILNNRTVYNNVSLILVADIG